VQHILNAQILHGGLDRGLVDHAIALRGMAVAGPDARTRHLDAQKQRRPLDQIAQQMLPP
jgi:hypothetical protein